MPAVVKTGIFKGGNLNLDWKQSPLEKVTSLIKGSIALVLMAVPDSRDWPCQEANV